MFPTQLNRFWDLIQISHPLPSKFLLVVFSMLGYKMEAEVNVSKERL